MKNELNRRKIVEIIQNQYNAHINDDEKKLDKSDINDLLSLTTDIIIDGVATKGTVVIEGFGKFEHKVIKPHEKKNMKTGKKYMTYKRNKIKFTPTNSFKEYVETLNKGEADE